MCVCACVCVLLHLFGQKWFRVSLKTSPVSRLLASLIPLITAQLRLADRGTITDYYNLFFFCSLHGSVFIQELRLLGSKITATNTSVSECNWTLTTFLSHQISLILYWLVPVNILLLHAKTCADGKWKTFKEIKSCWNQPGLAWSIAACPLPEAFFF